MLFNACSRKAFNLVELIIVIVITGILLTFAVPAFINVKIRAEDREARTNLKILQTAVKNYGIDQGHYDPGTPMYSCRNTVGCNTHYDLDLPVGNWNYFVSQHYGQDGRRQGIICAGANKINRNADLGRRCEDPEENCLPPSRSWHIWGFNETARDCRRGGGWCSTADPND